MINHKGLIVVRLITFLIVFLGLSACGGGGAGSGSGNVGEPEGNTPVNKVDTIPDTFVFNALNGQDLSSVVQSNQVTISGIDASATIRVEGGEYAINGGAFQTQSSEVNQGDQIRLQLSTSSEYSTVKRMTVTIGEVSAVWLVTTLANQPSNSPVAVNRIEQFAFNHSLWDHNASQLAATPIWIGSFAKAAGNDYETSGQFSRSTDGLDSAVQAQLGYVNAGVKESWEEAAGLTFDQVSLNNMIFMPLNFVQLDNSPASIATQAISVIDFLANTHPEAPFYIYEHWQDMGDPFPPSAQRLQDYHNTTRGSYHEWFQNYYQAITSSRPNAEVFMVPVGPVIADVLTNPNLQASGIEVLSLYEDSAPHGTDNLYFLAGLVTYQAIFRQKAPSDYQAPDTIHNAIKEEFSSLNDYVWQRLHFYQNAGVRIWP